MKKNHYHSKSKPIFVPRFKKSHGFSTTEKDSIIHKKIKSKDTKPEIKLRKVLWSMGYRYRLKGNIIGKPDIVFNQKRIVIFIDGDFWHGYNWDERKAKLKTNTKYWIPKIERNMQRDIEINSILIEKGWTVLRFWEHEIKNNIGACIHQIISHLNTSVE